jgi:hypothetical protein
VFLSALVNVAPYDFRDDAGTYFVGDDENNEQTSEEILTSTIALND